MVVDVQSGKVTVKFLKPQYFKMKCRRFSEPDMKITKKNWLLCIYYKFVYLYSRDLYFVFCPDFLTKIATLTRLAFIIIYSAR